MQRKKNTAGGDENKIKRLEGKIRGLKAVGKGSKYEQKVASYLSEKENWVNLQFNVHKYLYEYDIVAKKEGFLGDIEYLVVECKDKERVTANEVLRFENKVYKYNQNLPEVFGDRPKMSAYLCYSGEIDKEAKIRSEREKQIKFIKI